MKESEDDGRIPMYARGRINLLLRHEGLSVIAPYTCLLVATVPLYTYTLSVLCTYTFYLYLYNNCNICLFQSGK